MRSFTHSALLRQATLLSAVRAFHQQRDARPHSVSTDRPGSTRRDGYQRRDNTNFRRPDRDNRSNDTIRNRTERTFSNHKRKTNDNRSQFQNRFQSNERIAESDPKNSAKASSSNEADASQGQRLPRSAPGMGWSYDSVNKNGKTEMDQMYEKEYEKISAILSTVVEEVVNPSMSDGATAPDFAIGLQYYNHGLRNTYQSLIAKQLGLHHSQVKLSTAWSSRYDPKQFPKGVQMVLGVTLLERLQDAHQSICQRQPRRLLYPPQTFSNLKFSPEAKPLYDEGSIESQSLRSAIGTLVKEISALVLPQLVAVQIVKATTSVSEVEYNKEMDSAASVWRKFGVPQQLFLEVKVVLQELIKVFSAVIIHDKSPYREQLAVDREINGEKNDLPSRLDKDRDLVLPIGAGEPVSFVDVVLPQWEKMFAKTELVPLVLNSWELEEALKDADMKVPPTVADLAAKIPKGKSLEAESLDAARTLSAVVAAATYDIVSRMATVARVEEMGTMTLSSTTSHRFGVPRVLPACFIHGVFVGGIAEMTYLSSNSSAFRAMAANPHAISMSSNKIQTQILTNRKVVQNELEGMTHDPRMQ